MEGKQKLYIATNLSELKEKYAKSVEYNKSQAYGNYIQTSKRVHEAILTAENDGDDERLYCLSMRYCSTYSMLKKYFPHKSSEIKADMPFVVEVLETLERVNEILKKRYNNPMEFLHCQEGEKLSEASKKVGEINNNELSPHQQEKTNENETNDIKQDEKKDSLSVQEFYKLQKENPSVLVFDLREEREWKASKLKMPNQINVPQSFLLERQVVTAKDIEMCLDENAIELWLDRNAFETVVFCDWYGLEKSFVHGSSFSILQNALLKWSPDVEMKCKPMILRGGFRDVAELYPMLVSNAKVNPPKLELEPSINDKLTLSKLTLKEEANSSDISQEIPKDQNVAEIFRPTRPTVDRSKKPKDRCIDSFVAPENRTRLENSTAEIGMGVAYPSIMDELSKPAKIPGTPEGAHVPSEIDDSSEITKPAKISSVPIVDRTLKPQMNDGHDDQPRIAGKSNEAMSEVQKLLKQLHFETEARQKLEERTRQLEKEKEDLMSQQVLKELEREPTPKDEKVETHSEKSAKTMTIELNTLRTKKPLNLTDDLTSKEIFHDVSAEHTKDDEPSAPKPSNTNSTVPDVQPVKEKSPEATDSAENTYYQQLRDDSASCLTNRTTPSIESDMKRNALKRTNSSPNLAKNFRDTQKIVDTSSPKYPAIRRDNKPDIFDRQKILQFDRRRLEAFQPVYGSTSNGLCGLRNMGNTCYMNACLQCLSHSFLLKEYIVRGILFNDIKPNNKEGLGGVLVSEFTLLLRALWSGNIKVLSPIDVKQALSRYKDLFLGTNQEDAQECLTALLDGLHVETNQAAGQTTSRIGDSESANKSDNQLAEISWYNHSLDNKSIIVDLFQGQYKSVVECLTCHKKSTSFDIFMYLSLPIPNGSRITLMDCLNLYCAPEEIEWNCPVCQQRRKATKKLEIWKWPIYLIIHLKRFKYTTTFNRVKVHNKVIYNHLLQSDAQWRMKYNKDFMLYGVVQHCGDIDSGHYIANVYVAKYKKWFKFDDHEIYSIDDKDKVISQYAYLLFYTTRADIIKAESI